MTVNNGAIIGGYGTSSGQGFSIGNTGTLTARANVLVGMNSPTDQNTSHVLTLLGSNGTSTIANANLTFNLNAAVAGGLGGTSNGGSAGGLGVAGSGTELSVGGTLISFGTGVKSVQLTLNIQGEPAIIGQYTPYVLIAGTGVTTDTNGVSGGQYTGLTLGTVTTLSSGVTETLIQGSNLALAFSGDDPMRNSTGPTRTSSSTRTATPASTTSM